MKKIILMSIIAILLSSSVFSAGFSKGKCSFDLTMTQNLKAPKKGEKYIRNGNYHWYTKTIVKEAHILQKHLNRLGFNAGKVDGIIGLKTKGAILRLQKFLGTKQDGYVGPKTRALLNNSCGDIWKKIEKFEDNQNYSGDLKIMHGEKNLKDFIEKTKYYQKRSFGENLTFIEGDNILEDMEIENFDMTNLDSVAVKMVSLEGGKISDFSETNTQVEGIDESDITKTDGKYIYTISKLKKLFIFDASNPEDMKTVSKITADKNEFMREMYIHKKRLILISNYRENSSPTNRLGKKISVYSYPRNKSFTRIEIYNIENPEKPTKIKKIDFEGNLGESRIVNNHLYFITNKWIYNDFPIIPTVKIDNKISTNIFGNDFYYIDTPFANKNLTSISALNLDNLSQMSSKRILMPRMANIYVSKNNFYVTYNKYINWNTIYKDVEEKISKLMEEREQKLDYENIKILSNGKIDFVTEDDGVDDISITLTFKDGVFNATEKKESVRKLTQKEKDENQKYLLKKKKEIDEDFNKKIGEIVREFYKKNKDNFEKTKIEKFSLDGVRISVNASGEVSGFALNQFSMHEDEDKNFFIATTKNQNWLPWQLRKFLSRQDMIMNESKNNLYSLDKNLKKLDSIEELAKGERIKSVRFVKDHAYLVTFKQTDPLFNIDISNPKRLELLGELKIDGFSQYLHPVFDDRLIGLGREVYFDKYGNQRNGGLKVTLFDVSRNKPKEIKSIILGENGSYSEALNNHKAILISENKNIMAFPVTLYEKSTSDNYYNRDVETGVMLLNIEQDNISKISLLETGSGWEQKAKRAIRIGDVVHAVSIEKSRSFDLKDGKELGKIFFEEEEEITTY